MCNLLLRLLAHETETYDAVDRTASRAHVEKARDHDITMRIVRPILVRNLIGRERPWDAQLGCDADVSPREHAGRGDARGTDSVNALARH